MMSVTTLGRILCLSVLCVSVGCTAVPRTYLREAVPNLTFSTLAATPHLYQDRLVLLGAVIMKEEMRDGDLWLHVKNRPLNENYRPQLPPSPNDHEGGWYWIVVNKHQTLPRSYRHWADMTIVGRVTGAVVVCVAGSVGASIVPAPPSFACNTTSATIVSTAR